MNSGKFLHRDIINCDLSVTYFCMESQYTLCKKEKTINIVEEWSV